MRRLTPRFTLQAPWLMAEKPSGISTHSPDPERMIGFVEYLQIVLQKKLYISHRLDRDTSGALVLSISPEASTLLTEHLQNKQVQKTYFFLTDKTSSSDEFEVFSNIDKKGSQFVSVPCERNMANAHTRLKKIKSDNGFHLWQAQPVTGRSHQIRLHAQDSGIAILGDYEHGGSDFPFLCLHSETIEASGLFSHSVGKPVFFDQLSDLKNQNLCILQKAVFNRDLLFSFQDFPQECLRLLHLENPRYKIDLFGDVLWVYWYDEEAPSDSDLKAFESLRFSLKKKSLLLRKMLNRGQDPLSKQDIVLGDHSERWIACENTIKYEFRTDSGLSPGLFLDQRENRLWVRENSKQKRVLNLFAYTAGFSVNAALGGASEVVTVDVSGNFIDWSKTNFSLNSLDPNQFEFFAADSLFFLDRAHKRGRKFDLIVCDPPSFSRSKDKVFRIEKDLPELLKNTLALLDKNGVLFLSLNYEKWTREMFHKFLTRHLPLDCQIQPTPPQGLDHEMPHQEPLMKSIFIKKR